MDYPDDCKRHLKINYTISQFEEENRYQNLNNEHDLLINTLKTIWQNYMDYIENSDIKNHWLKLFFYNYQFVCTDLLSDSHFQRFIKPIPYQLYSYLIEQTYDIISKSDYYVPNAWKISSDVNCIEEGYNNTTNEKLTQTPHQNLKKVSLSQPNDYSKIIELRKFLTKGLGKHILTFLLHTDIEYIASKKSQINLYLSFFPNCLWSTTDYDRQLTLPDGIYNFVTNFKEHIKCPNICNQKKIVYDFNTFLNYEKTSDEIALLLIDLLEKCITTSSSIENIYIDKHYVNITILNFCFKTLLMEDKNFSSLNNAECIKFRIVYIIRLCLKNLFLPTNDELTHEFQVYQLFHQIRDIVKYNKHISKVLYSLLYIIFYTLHCMVVDSVYSKKNDINNQSTLHELADEDILTDYVNIIEYALIHYPPSKHPEYSLCFADIYWTILRIINNLRKYEQTFGTSNAFKLHKKDTNQCLSNRSSINKKKSEDFTENKYKQMHCFNNEAINEYGKQLLSCLFQRLILNLLPSLPLELQEDTALYFAKYSICCCHYTLNTYRMCLNLVTNQSIYYQKHIYKFLKNCIVKTMCQHIQNTAPEHLKVNNGSKTISKISCIKCASKINSLNYQNGLLAVYNDLCVKTKNSTNLQLLLQHFKQILPILCDTLAADILTKIILPIFYYSKDQLYFLKNTTDKASDMKTDELTENELIKLLSEVLKTLIVCLRNVNAIKAFYNEENVKHVEDLIVLVPFSWTQDICDIIKIGIENITCLGGNAFEKISLSRRLIKLQLNMSYKAYQLFTNLIINVINSKQINTKYCESPFSINGQTNDDNIEQIEKMQLFHIIKVLNTVSAQWSLTFNLLKTSHYFYNEFIKSYPFDNQIKQSLINSNMYEINTNCIIDDIFLSDYCYKSLFDILLCDNNIYTIARFNLSALIAFLLLPKMHDPNKNTEEDILRSDETLNFIGNIPKCYCYSIDNHNSMDCSLNFFDAYENYSAFPDSIIKDNSWNFDKCSKHFLARRKPYENNFCNKSSNNDLCDFVKIYDIRNQNVGNDLNLYKKQNINKLIIDAILNLKKHEYYNEHSKKLIQMLSDFSQNIFNQEESFNNVISSLHQEPLYNSHLACKMLLLKLFEITLFIWLQVMRFQNGADPDIKTHLSNIKNIIIYNGLNKWEQYAYESSGNNFIIQVLEILLRIARVSNTDNLYGDVLKTISTNETDEKFNTNDNTTDKYLFTKFAPTTCTFKLLTDSFLNVKEMNDLTNALLMNNSESYCEKNLLESLPCVNLSDGSELDLSETECDVSVHNKAKFDNEEEYDGDAEILTKSETEEISVDDNSFEIAHSKKGLSLHQMQRTDLNICEIIAEIIIEFSRKCCLNPSGWYLGLTQFVNRFFVLRNTLSNATSWLKSIKPILNYDNIELKELQQALLDPIIDIKTPEVLLIFLNVLATKNPPIALLVRHINRICNNTLCKPQPTAEIIFPINGETCKTSFTIDSMLSKYIYDLSEEHIKRGVVTPITRSPCIIPIKSSQFWNHETKFTISLWLQLKNALVPKTSNRNGENTHYNVVVDQKTHVFTIGNNYVMISVYINHNGQWAFEIFKPDSIELLGKVTSIENFSELDQQELANNPNFSDNKMQSSMHCKNRNSSQSSSLSKAFKNTKQALLNSLSSLNLFSENSAESSEGDCGNAEATRVDLQQYFLIQNKWTHFTFAICIQRGKANIVLSIDAFEQYTITIPFPYINNAIEKNRYQMLLLGDQIYLEKSTISSESSLTNNMFCYSISNLIMFDKFIEQKEIICHLTAMGPNFTEFSACHVENLKPNYSYLNLSKASSANFGSYIDVIKYINDSRVFIYSAQNPEWVIDNNKSITESMSYIDINSEGQLTKVIRNGGELRTHHLQSFQNAIRLCGGLSTILYLFARSVELTNDSEIQMMSLNLLLGIAHSDNQLYTEFLRNEYISLIGYVIKSDRCTKDCHLLKSIVNNACSMPLIITKSDHLTLNENTMSIIIYPHLLISILHRYSDWHRSGTDNSAVLDMFFLSILALTREKHPQRDFNIEQLKKYGLMKELLNFCKIYIVEFTCPIYISKTAAEAFISIISIFAGSPPCSSLLDEIMKLLLLLHKPSECFITHDKSKFYFLCTSNVFSKEKPAAIRNEKKYINFQSLHEKNFYELSKIKNNVNGSMNRKWRHIRINQHILERLRWIYKTHFLYNKVLQKFEKDLQMIVNYSKLNKNILYLLNLVQFSRWPRKHKRFYTKSINNNHAKLANNYENRISRSHCSKNCSSVSKPQRLRRIFKRYITVNTIDNISALNKKILIENNIYLKDTNKDNAINLRSSDKHFKDKLYNNKANILHESNNKKLVKVDVSNNVGISTLQSGLLLLLKNFFCLLPDNSIEEVLKHYVKVEFLVVLANQGNSMVRNSVIQLLHALSKRFSTEDIQACIHNFYDYHLANQLTIYSVDMNMFESCLEWVTGCKYTNLSSTLGGNYDMPKFCIQQRLGLNALLAIASKSPLSSSISCSSIEKIFKILRDMYNTDHHQRVMMIEAAIIPSAIKALYYMYARSNSNLFTSVEASIINLLITIGDCCIKSLGHINVIWDIINITSFYLYGQIAQIIQVFRSAQAKLLLAWLETLNALKIDTENTKFYNYKDTVCLPKVELKTRMDLLINRAIQIFTASKNHLDLIAPTNNEVNLFKFLINYISTNQRSNNFIVWGLQLTQSKELREFIINKIWLSLKANLMSPNIMNDDKSFKALLWLNLVEDAENSIENLSALCQYLGISKDDFNWNVENELHHLVLQSCTNSAKQQLAIEKTFYRFEQLAQNCIESSMIYTRRVAESQNSERKLLINHMKDYNDTHIYTKWLDIIRRMTHCGAPWYSEHSAENFWELDYTEGPSRIHNRLKRCYLNLDKRFLLNSTPTNGERQQKNGHLPCGANDHCCNYSRPLNYLISSYDRQLNITLNSPTLFNFPAIYIPADGEIVGEIIVTNHKLYFLATYHCKYFNVNCDISNITEIWIKRYQHQEKAFEVFLDTNQSLFFSLQNQEDLKEICDLFCDKIIQPPDHNKLLIITNQWRDGLLTNWEYLMSLNQIAGRTYNDLMQYPVFPWILSNYSSNVLDLNDIQHFRKLDKPIAVQNKESERYYIDHYMHFQNSMISNGSFILKPYHYSSHYSNSGTVLHFLVRVPPFTSYFLHYQDNKFDMPDRTFHSLNATWNLASRDSPTDVKELIPEFFCLPEMFENFLGFNFGCRQDGDRVEDVSLPPWCLYNPRLFVLIHRQALESPLVRNHLHEWIDLIFGYKQTGEEAIEAINVFHPSTYSTFLESECNDAIERDAMKTMVKTYGQMPRQLFKIPHPMSRSLKYLQQQSSNNSMTSSLTIPKTGTLSTVATTISSIDNNSNSNSSINSDVTFLDNIRGLRWGAFAGSPQLPAPSLSQIHYLPYADYLLSFNQTNVIYGFPKCCHVMQGGEPDCYNIISWGYDDRVVKIQSFNKTEQKAKNLLYDNAFDNITSCGSDVNSNQLWFGHKSGLISVYKCINNELRQRLGKNRQNYMKGLRLSYNSAFRKITATKPFDMENVSNYQLSNSIIGATNSNQFLFNDIGATIGKNEADDLQWIGPTTLIYHKNEITCITLSVDFKIAITASCDGIAVIWDLNDWSYVRTIERPDVHAEPITLICISPTLGDIVTVHTPQFTDCNKPSNKYDKNSFTDNRTATSLGSYSSIINEDIVVIPQTVPDECYEVTEENLDDFINVSINHNGNSILRLYSINGRYIQHIAHQDHIVAICYSFIKEGVGVNVIATAFEDGVIRLWSSWNLSFVTEINTGLLNIKSIVYSTHQYLVVLAKDSHIQIWETDDLCGNAPRFPQITYK